MVFLIIGGSGSGKSEFAENCCMRLTEGKKLYIATMEPYDEESRRRVARHRRMRDGKGFDTLELRTHLEEVKLPLDCTVLLECLSNLAANEMFSPGGRGEDAETVILEGLQSLAGQAGNLVIVTNDVFSDGAAYDEGTQKYLRVMAGTNARVAELADTVCQVVCGIPILLKGKLPGWESE